MVELLQRTRRCSERERADSLRLKYEHQWRLATVADLCVRCHESSRANRSSEQRAKARIEAHGIGVADFPPPLGAGGLVGSEGLHVSFRTCSGLFAFRLRLHGLRRACHWPAISAAWTSV